MTLAMETRMSSSNGAVPKPVTTQLMFVTPDMATRWLEGNTVNRKLRKKAVSRLVRDIQNGRWKITHQGIAFDVSGALRDGQHRLNAIREARVGVWVNVTFNLPADSMLVIDQILPRSTADQITLSGELGMITHGEIAVLRRMLSGFGGATKLTVTEEQQALTKHIDAIRFAMSHTQHRIAGVFDAAMRAVIARAYYSADHGRLARFCQVLRDGMASNEDEQVIVKLWRTLISLANETGMGSTRQQLRYAKVQRALIAYLRGEKLDKIYSANSELFPLPDELEATA